MGWRTRCKCDETIGYNNDDERAIKSQPWMRFGSRKSPFQLPRLALYLLLFLDDKVVVWVVWNPNKDAPVATEGPKWAWPANRHWFVDRVDNCWKPRPPTVEYECVWTCSWQLSPCLSAKTRLVSRNSWKIVQWSSILQTGCHCCSWYCHQGTAID